MCECNNECESKYLLCFLFGFFTFVNDVERLAVEDLFLFD